MDPVFRGSTEECLAHFSGARFEGDKKEAVAAFCNVSIDNTARRWLSPKHPIKPAGANLIKVRYYLDHLGYDVAELRALEDPVRDLGRLIAFSVVTFEDAMDAVGIPKRDHGGGQLYVILHGEQGLSEERREKVVAFVNEFRQYLPDAVASVPKLRYLNGDTPKRELPPRPVPPQAAPSRALATALEETALAHAIAGLHALLKLTAAELGPEGRERVRQIAGKQVVFETSNYLEGLCSETAFKMHHRSYKEDAAC